MPDFNPADYGLSPDTTSGGAPVAASGPPGVSGFDPKAFGLVPTSEAPKRNAEADAPVSLGRVAAQATAGAVPGIIGAIPDTLAAAVNRSPLALGALMGIYAIEKAAGLPTPGLVRLPEGAVTQAVDTGMQRAGIGPGPPQNAPERIARGIGTGAALGIRGGPAAMLTGAAAGGVGAAAEELPGLPESWKPAAGFLGSLIGGGVTAAATSAPRAVAETVLTPGVQRDVAATRFAGLADDPAAAGAALAAPPAATAPANATTAQAAHDAGFAAATNALKGDAAVQRDATLNVQAAARADALRAATPAGDPAALPTALRAEQAGGTAAADALVGEATTAAQAAAGRLPAVQTPEALGATQRAAISAQHDSLKTTEDAAWTAVRALPLEVPGDTVRNVVANTYAGLPAATKLAPEETAIQDLVGTTPVAKGGYADAPSLPMPDMLALRTRIGEAQAKARAAGDNDAAGRFKQLYKGVQNAIENAAGAGTPEAQTIADASAATRARTAFAAQPQNAAALATDRGGAPTTPASALPKTVFEPGATGAETAQRFIDAVGPGVAVPILHDNAANTLLAMRGALRADGTVDPGVLAQFQARYANAIRGIPGAPALYADVESASRAVADAEAVRREAVAHYETGAAGALLGLSDAGSVTARVGQTLAATNAPEQFGQLAAAARQAGPTATAGLRRATVDAILARYVNPTTGLLRENGLLAFLAKPQTAGALAQVLEPAEIANLRGVAAQIERESALQQAAGQRPGLLGAEAPKPTMGGIVDIGKKLVAAAAGGVAGHLSGVPGAELAGAGAATMLESAIGTLRARGIANINSMIEEALLDPVAGRLLLDAARTTRPSAWQRFAGRMGAPTLGTGAVLGATTSTQGPAAR